MTDSNVRKYGEAPFLTAVVHGGPGAAGEMAAVAKRLGEKFGVLEPLQRAMSVYGQVEELAQTLKTFADGPAVLVGHSWGAWLACLTAARYPQLVKKLILVSSGAFEEKYVSDLMAVRLARLSNIERKEAELAMKRLSEPDVDGCDEIMSRFGELMGKADAYCEVRPSPDEENLCQPSGEIYNAVWPEAAKLRSNGDLLKEVEKIACPVVAIHGLHDPTPADGVELPLQYRIDDFTFITFENCGHNPWKEKYAREKFYAMLEMMIKEDMNNGF